MENRKELLEQYMEDGKLPLKGELFARKSVVGGKLEEFREEKRADALTSRPNAAGRQKLIVLRSSCIYWRVAALFILLFGIGGYYYLSEEKITSEAVAVDYKLPDGSSVKLMQNSTLSYNKVSWLWGRKLNLLGSAFFDVTPGKTFTVRTEAGDATVLGTKFLVEQEGKTITVNCEEGTVKVETPIGEQTLNAGESVRCDENKIGPVQEKEELPEVLGYEDDPLVNVVADIQHIFDVEVVGCEKYNELYYNGTILTRDLHETLKKVFGSLGINYQLSGQKVILE